MSTPSLLNIPYLYKAGTLYSQIPESGAGDFTVTRTTTVANRSTRINKDGLIELVNDNVPRLDYPLGGAVNGCPALLVEPSATNLLQRSEEFNDAYWGKTGSGAGSAPVVTPNIELAPDGTNNADRIVFALNGGTTSNDESRLNSATLTYAAASHISSVYIRTTDGSTVTITFLNADGQSANKTITPTYQRITHITTGAGTSSFRIRLRGGVTSDSASVAIWGAQYEAGSVATSYIPTTTTPVTRSNEVISDTTASALIGQTEGTIYAEVTFAGGLSSRPLRHLLNISDGTDNNRVLFYIGDNTTNILGFITANGSNLLNNGASFAGVTSAKIAIAYKSADYAIYVNGVVAASGTTAFSFATTLNQVTIGSRHNLINQFNDRIRAVALYPNRIPNTAAPGVLSLATLTAP